MANTWCEGDRVEGGDTARDYDTGTIVEVEGDVCVVAWDRGVTTRIDAWALRCIGDDVPV